MKLLINNTDYKETISISQNLNGDYNNNVIFHCFWNGILNEKHFYSILSCYYFNILNKNNKIILWLENNTPNKYNDEILKYAEIRYFSLNDEINNTNFINHNFYYNKSLSFYSDVVRYLLLYNYSGIWFDLDVFFLRSFDPLFVHYENEICVYQWENQNYPNGAIYISLEAKSEKMKKNIEFIINRNNGWGFQEAYLNYDLPLDMLVLPYSWFDPSWLSNPYNIYFVNFFDAQDKVYDFDNFFKGSFCYHWHNQWNKPIAETSIMSQLVKIIQKNL
jgi:hypothetical protein